MSRATTGAGSDSRPRGPGAPGGHDDRPAGVADGRSAGVGDVRPAGIDDAAAIACLAGLPGMTSARLRLLLAGGSPGTAIAVVRGEQAPPSAAVAALLEGHRRTAGSWSHHIDRHPPEWWGDELRRSAISVHRPGDPSFPQQLVVDPRAPAALFVRGDLQALAGRRVGVVGTRNCTRRGRAVATRFGAELAAAGVAVVSGLALGVDGAAHEGVLRAGAAPPIAVVGSGPDVVYPRRHAELWRRVADVGVIVSEWPPGTRPDAFRFPLRNRLIAALSEVVVVVESRERGGSLITAREAAERGVDVFAVPGPIDCRASAGTNRLLYDGASPATSVDDILVALDLDHRRAGQAHVDSRPPPSGSEARVLDTCTSGPVTVESIARDLGLSLVEAALALARLERSGWLYETGGWFEAADG